MASINAHLSSTLRLPPRIHFIHLSFLATDFAAARISSPDGRRRPPPAPTTPRASPATPSSSSSAAAPPSPSALLAHLAAAGVSVLPGLSDPELAHAEAALGGLQLPPDLRDLLAIGVPSGDGFPDYRSPAGLRLLRFAAEEVPAAVAAALPAPRWIEFWTDAAIAGDRFVEVSTCTTTTTRANAAARMPQWVRSYLEWAGSVLRRGGWGGGEVEEMTTESGGGEEAVALALTVDRCCGELGRAGWGAEEVVEALGALLGPRTRRAAVALPPDVAARVGRLAEAVSRAVFTGSGSAGNPEPAKRPF
uniref:Knr4/Smi1-like domain-containing protein n=1 Tax=Oryza punctata TaxID=4537 RepID=A0A0E0KEP5_ORYPU